MDMRNYNRCDVGSKFDGFSPIVINLLKIGQLLTSVVMLVLITSDIFILHDHRKFLLIL